jgi:hypothetical protein
VRSPQISARRRSPCRRAKSPSFLHAGSSTSVVIVRTLACPSQPARLPPWPRPWTGDAQVRAAAERLISVPAGERRVRRRRCHERRRPAAVFLRTPMPVGAAAWAINAVAMAAWCIEFQHHVGMRTWLHPIGVNRVLAIHKRVPVVLRWL